MKKYNILILLSLVLVLFSCEDYLDQVPEEKLTDEDLFKSKDDAIKVLTQVYSTYLNPLDFTEDMGFASDELDANWSGYIPALKDKGEFTSNNGKIADLWKENYNAIRTSIKFITRIDECEDDKLTDQEKELWRNEAKFLQAYYYFLLLRNFGPVPLMTKNYTVVDVLGSLEEGFPRASYDVIANHIDTLLIAAEKVLDGSYSTPDRAGRANATACKFLRSRLALYSASPLYNGLKDAEGNTKPQLMVKSLEDEDLLNATYSPEKWETARDLSLEAIEFAEENGYGFITDDDYPQGLDAHKRVFSFPRGGEPSSEMIFYKQNFSSSNFNNHALSTSWSKWTGLCPIWSHVEEYFTAKGLLTSDDVDYQNASGFHNYSYDGKDVSLFNKFRNREPRFYSNILFPEQLAYAMKTSANEVFDRKWSSDNTEKNYFRPYFDGPDGFGSKKGRDYCTTGFLAIKWLASSATSNNMGDYAVPIFRYSELLLNYIEAAFEYDVTMGNSPLANVKLFEYWDKLRAQVGLTDVRTAYQNAGITLTNEKLRELIRNERRIELAFEGHRYYDNRRWLDAEREGGDKKGFDIQRTADAGFWNLVVFETRYWNDKLYFTPIPQDELVKNKKLSQNPLWE